MNKFYKLIIGISLLVIGGCDALDLAPEDYFGENNFWKNKEEVRGFVVGLHKQLRDRYYNFQRWGEYRGGLFKSSPSTTMNVGNDEAQLKKSLITEQDPSISDWGDLYSNIFQVNLLIEKLEGGLSFLSEKDENYFKGQAYGLRAFYYFHLYRCYGGVPIVTEPKVANGVTNPTALYTPRATPKATLQFILDDITASEKAFAEDNFTFEEQRAFWSKAATLMLKAEAYLWKAKVPVKGKTAAEDFVPDNVNADILMAEKALNEVLGCSSIGFAENFSSVFDYANKGNREIIFTYRFLMKESTNYFSAYTYSDDVFKGSWYSRDGVLMYDTLALKSNGIQRNEYLFSFFERFDDEDVRRDRTFLDFYNKERTIKGLVFKKFLGVIDEDSGQRYYSDDIPVWRYTDVLLLMAEVKNAKGEDPSSYINEVRRRAYGENWGPEFEYHNQDKTTNEEAIYWERQKEFVGEFKTWYDDLRMRTAGGKAFAFHLGVLDESLFHDKLLWPINKGIMDLDDQVEQTPGY